MKLLIVRHADPDYSIDSLTPTGWREAELLSDRLVRTPADFYYVSPLGRAQDTYRADHFLVVVHRGHGRRLARHEQQVLESPPGNNVGFRLYLFESKHFPVNIVIVVETAVHAEIRAVIGNVQGNVQLDRVPESFQGQAVSLHGHVLQQRCCRRGDQRHKII